MTVAGGASFARQYPAAGLGRWMLDEIDLSIVPALLGAAERAFDGIDVGDIHLEQLGAVEAPGVTHVRYRVEHR